jgi:hypothetical protein
MFCLFYKSIGKKASKSNFIVECIKSTLRFLYESVTIKLLLKHLLKTGKIIAKQFQ